MTRYRMPPRSSASNAPPPRSIPRSRLSTSMRSGPTPPTWNAAPRPSRSGSPASRCAAGRCRNGCSRGRAFGGRSPTPSPRRCGWRGTGLHDILVAYPTADRGALRELARLTAERPEARISIMVDSLAQLELLDAALAAGPATATASPSATASARSPSSRMPRSCIGEPARHPCASAWSWMRGCGCWTGACASAPNAPPCTPPRRLPRSPARSSPAGASSWWG